MKTLKTSAILLTLLTILLGIIYPYFMWGIGQVFFHKHANGTLFFYKDKKVLGSEWIAQNFTQDEYFHPRPSSAGDKGYDASNSSGSNLGPTSQKLIDTLKSRSSDYRAANQLSPTAPIPADAITTSGSGLDPHISPENALLQAPRISAARNLPLDQLSQLIDAFTEGRTLAIFGEKRINVLRINLELDKLAAQEK